MAGNAPVAIHTCTRGTRRRQHLVLEPSLGTTAHVWTPALEHPLARRPDLSDDVADGAHLAILERPASAAALPSDVLQLGRAWRPSRG
jgi:hypothetical protein